MEQRLSGLIMVLYGYGLNNTNQLHSHKHSHPCQTCVLIQERETQCISDTFGFQG